MPALRLTFAILLLSLLALSQSACSGTRVGVKSAEAYNARPLKVYIPLAVDDPAAIKAAESGLIGRGWAVIDKSDEHITGKLHQRRFEATVDIKIEDQNLVIYSDSTYLDPQTNELTPAVPYGWLKNLQQDIQKFVAYENYRNN